MRTPDLLLDLVLEGVAARLSTPIEDRAEAILLIAGGLRAMMPESRHAVALIDLDSERAA